jgi:hypothetical protein
MTRTVNDERASARGLPERRRAWRNRLRLLSPRDPGAVAPPERRAEDAYHVLQDARAVIEHGWVQNRWFVPAKAAARVGAPPAAAGDDRGLPAACLVGAVVYAARRHGTPDDLAAAGSALDHLWDAWQEARGVDGAGIAGRAAPRDLRLARVRDLTRWNDHPGRTRQEVLGLLDVASSRAIMAAVGGR